MRLRRLALPIPVLAALAGGAAASDPILGIGVDEGPAIRLAGGQAFVAEGEGGTRLRLLDDSLVEVERGSILVVHRLDLGPLAQHSRIEVGLEQGAASFVRDPAWSTEMRVDTPLADVQLRDAVAAVSVEPGAGLALTLCQGEATLGGTAAQSIGWAPVQVTLRPGGGVSTHGLDGGGIALCRDLEQPDARGLTAAAALRRSASAPAAEPEGAPVVGAGTAQVLRPLVNGLAGGSDREPVPSITTLTATPSSVR